jgi:hypothetical protein
VPLVAIQLKRHARRAGDVDGVLDLMFGFRIYGVGLASMQRRWEFRRLLEEVARLRPQAMLEIGTAAGGSLFALTQVCASDAHILSIDLPHGRFGGGYQSWKIPLYNAFARRGQRLDLIRADSHDDRTVADVQDRLGGRKLDFLFIDGDHSYEGVKRDLNIYSPLVRSGGLVAFHDIFPLAPGTGDGLEDPGDVWRFWAELDVEGKREFVDPESHGGMGIGVITV